MLNEEKVILMTQMASYEENEGKKNMAIGRYFRSDYIAIQVLKSILCATIAYGVCFALFVFYDFENFIQDGPDRFWKKCSAVLWNNGCSVWSGILSDLLSALCTGEKEPEMLL